MKKFLSFLLASLMVLALLAACGSDSGSGSNNSEPGVANTNTDQTEFNVISGISALSAGFDDNPVLNAMMDNAGIKINWETMADSLGEQVNIRLQAGTDLPDAVQVGWSNYDLGRYGRGGTFIDLTPYVTDSSIMPNLAAILEKYPKVKAAITQDDGKIYGLPAGEMMGTAAVGDSKDLSIHSIQQFSMINKKWLDDLGLKVPETVEELKTALQAFKDNDMAHKIYGADPGNTIPMTFGYDQWCWGQNIFFAPFGLTNWSDVCADLRLTKDKEVVFDCVSDEYRNAITYYHDWYADGLIDIEVFSQNDKQYLAKCAQGYVGVATWWEISSEIMGDFADDYVALPPLKGPDGTCTVTIKSAGSAVNSGLLSITKSCKSPANLLKFYDQWYTGENVMQLQYGPIGVYFNEEKDAQGMYVSISDEEAQAKFGKSTGELKGAYEVFGPKLILSEYYTNVFHMEDRAMQRLNDLQNFWFNYVDDFTYYPVDIVLTEMELQDLDDYRPDFETHVREQEALWFRDDGPSDAEWEAYKQSLVDTYGMNKILEVYKNAYVVIGTVLLSILVELVCLALGVGKVEPDYRIAYVGTNNLPEDTVSALEEGLAALGEDLNNDGRVVVELRQYASSGGADSGTAYSAEIKLVADLTECESYFFLLENPAQFQLNYHSLRRLDGSLPEAGDYSADGAYLTWGHCPVLAAMELGEYSYRLMDKTVTGSGNDLVLRLFIARRGFWTEKTSAYSEGADSLWEKLTEGAMP